MQESQSQILIAHGFLELWEYPKAIADQQEELSKSVHFLALMRTEIDHINADIESAIAFDPDLKNEAQRKARKLEILQEDSSIQSQLLLIDDIELKRKQTEIKISRLKSEFTVRQLLLQQAIAEGGNYPGNFHS